MPIGNRQREKTFSQKMRESDHLLVIERERAKERHGGHHKDDSIGATLPELKEGRSRDIVADKIGMSCHTQEEIAAAVDLAAGQINEKIKQCSDLETFPKQSKVLATFQDEQFTTPLYNVWKWNTCTI